VQEVGAAARAVPVSIAADCSDVIFLAIPWTKLRTLPDRLLFAERILVDTTNPYSEQFEVLDLGEATSSEIVALHFPYSRVVKAFNTLYWETLATRGTKHIPHRLIIPVASNDVAAKANVSGLISDCGFAPLDVGALRNGGTLQQPGKLLFNRPLTLREGKELLSKSEVRE
jgi:predicted dinucleotide-binding enzyme